MSDPRRVIASRAKNLAPAAPYVRGWAEAERGAAALAEQLRAVGLESDFLGVKADVSVFGDGLVCLGPVRPEAAQRLAEMLAAGLAAEIVAGTAIGEASDTSAA